MSARFAAAKVPAAQMAAWTQAQQTWRTLEQAPMLGEKLGMLRAQGASALGKRELTPQGKGQLLVLQQRVAELQGDTFRGLDRVLRGNAELQRVQVRRGLSVGMLGGASRWLRAPPPRVMRSTPRWTT